MVDVGLGADGCLVTDLSLYCMWFYLFALLSIPYSISSFEYTLCCSI